MTRIFTHPYEYSKFWGALIAGGVFQLPSVMTLILLGWWFDPDVTVNGVDVGGLFMPTVIVVTSAVNGFWTAIASAFGALFPTNSEPAEGRKPEPEPEPEP